MEKKSAQRFNMTLNKAEFMPFNYFLTMASLPAELDDRWKVDQETMQCSLLLPSTFDPLILIETWLDWRKNSLEIDYAILN